MKRGIVILRIAIIAGGLAFWLTRSEKLADRQDVMLDSMPELTWVKSELKLSDSQFAKVSDLHAAYRPKCMEMCRRIAEAHVKVEELIRENPAVTPELEKAIQEHAAIHAECQQAMLHHIFQTSGVMDREQSARYLKEVVPFALNFRNSEPGEMHGR